MKLLVRCVPLPSSVIAMFVKMPLALTLALLVGRVAAGDGPPVIVAQPKRQIVPEGGSAVFEVFAEGKEPLFYQWLKNSSVLDAATDSILTVDNVQTNDVGAYQVVVTNAFGSVTSLVAVLNLLRAPVVSGACHPIANTDKSEFARASASDGVNFLVGIRGSAANPSAVAAQLMSPHGARVGGLITNGRTVGRVSFMDEVFTAAPRVAFGTTNYLMVWTDAATGNHLYAQFISRTGALVGDRFAIAPGLGGDQDAVDVAFDGTNFFVLWSTDTALYGRLVSQSGDAFGDVLDFMVTEGVESEAAVAFGDGRYLVTWMEGSDGLHAVKARLVSPAGELGEVLSISENDSFHHNPVNVAYGRGQFMVVWHHNNDPGSDWNLRGRLVQLDGSLTGNELTLVNGLKDEFSFGGCLVFDGDSFLLVWTAITGDLPTARGTLRGQYWKDDGQALSQPFTIASETVGQFGLGLSLGQGKVLVVVHSNLLTPAANLCARFISRVARAGCSYALSQPSQIFGASGGTGNVTVTTGDLCDWVANSPQPWITILGRTAGLGSSAISFDVDPNTTANQRTGQILIGDRVFSITQSPMETNKPVVAIIAPAVNARITNASVSIRGTARDNAGIERVDLRVDNSVGTGSYRTAVGTTTWTASADLLPGTNILRARAVDVNGNVSMEVSRAVFRVLRAPLALSSSGLGTVTPFQNGQALELGRSYKLNAFPGTGHVFSNWTGTVTSRSPSVVFIMASNTMIHANFVPNPFTPRKGSYNGVFREAASVRHESAGFFNLALTGLGNYSARLTLAGRKHPVSGQFNLEGFATNAINRAGLSPLSVLWGLDGASGNQVTGIVSTATWEAPLRGDLAPIFSALNPAPLRGQYTLAVTGAPGETGKPEGDGIGTAIVAGTGTLTLAGTLADGTPLAQSVPLSGGGAWPLYATLYAGRGSVFGWVCFDTNRMTDDLGGALTWTRPPGPIPNSYTNGFVLDTEVSGSRYLTAPADMRMVSIPEGRTEIGGGNLLQSYTNTFVLGTNNRFTNTGPARVTILFTPASGLFSGTFAPAGETKMRSLRGVVLQKSVQGTGFVSGTNRVGWVRLLPAP